MKRSRSPSVGSTRDRKSRRSASSDALSAREGPLKRVAAYIFRRDFRLHDNTSLIKLCAVAATAGIPVLPLFFFNPLQCDKNKNPYFGAMCFRFMCESLAELDEKQLENRLVCLRGSDETCLRHVRQSGFDIAMLGFNADYTPFALARDEALVKWCSTHGVTCVSDATDFTLLPLDMVVSGSNEPYSVFTPFYRRLLVDHVKKIRPVDHTAFHLDRAFVTDGKKLLKQFRVDPLELCADVAQSNEKAGRPAGLARLHGVAKLTRYAEERDFMFLDKTSHLSPYLKFGNVSVREVWDFSVRELGMESAFVRQLIWREFYSSLIHHHPQLVGGQLNALRQDAKPVINAPFQAKYTAFKWDWNPAHYKAFVAGQTGVPLVDAAVRCLTQTGWCHNRVRLVIGSFLLKVLGVDWREGERWYATVAVDYDVANNSGGWLWVSGQGADAQPFFRTFSPFRQAERFDPDCAYIKKWVPELRELPTRIIHRWDEYCEKLNDPARRTKQRKTPKTEFTTTYPCPIVNLRERTRAVIETFRSYNSSSRSN